MLSVSVDVDVYHQHCMRWRRCRQLDLLSMHKAQRSQTVQTATTMSRFSLPASASAVSLVRVSICRAFAGIGIVVGCGFGMAGAKHSLNGALPVLALSVHSLSLSLPPLTMCCVTAVSGARSPWTTTTCRPYCYLCVRELSERVCVCEVRWSHKMQLSQISESKCRSEEPKPMHTKLVQPVGQKALM